jgi:anti-sigma factor RsiW
MARHDPSASEDPREHELSERGRELVAAAVAETSAPLALRERLERQRESVRPSPRRRWLGLAGSFVAVAAAALAALVISLGGASAPGVLATVQLAGGGPTLPAPAHDARNPALLRTRIDGLPFPNWDEFEWRAVGAREDEIEGRRAVTVYYDSPRGARAAYTILGGSAIEPPDGARTLRLRGTTFHLLTQGPRRIVVWDRDGHTCVMSAPAAVPEERLLKLAAWDDGGNVPF